MPLQYGYAERMGEQWRCLKQLIHWIPTRRHKCVIQGVYKISKGIWILATGLSENCGVHEWGNYGNGKTSERREILDSKVHIFDNQNVLVFYLPKLKESTFIYTCYMLYSAG